MRPDKKRMRKRRRRRKRGRERRKERMKKDKHDYHAPFIQIRPLKKVVTDLL